MVDVIYVEGESFDTAEDIAKKIDDPYYSGAKVQKIGDRIFKITLPKSKSVSNDLAIDMGNQVGNRYVGSGFKSQVSKPVNVSSHYRGRKPVRSHQRRKPRRR